MMPPCRSPDWLSLLAVVDLVREGLLPSRVAILFVTVGGICRLEGGWRIYILEPTHTYIQLTSNFLARLSYRIDAVRQMMGCGLWWDGSGMWSYLPTTHTLFKSLMCKCVGCAITFLGQIRYRAHGIFTIILLLFQEYLASSKVPSKGSNDTSDTRCRLEGLFHALLYLPDY